MSVGLPSRSVETASRAWTNLVEPVARVSLAVQVLCNSSPWVTGKGPKPPGAVQLVVPVGCPSHCTGNGLGNRTMSAVLVTEPPGPPVPLVLTVNGPDGGVTPTLG